MENQTSLSNPQNLKPRPKIWACISVYNNEYYLRSTLVSIKYLCDGVIIVDGKYTTYPGTSHNSTDGTLEIIRSFRYHWNDFFDEGIHFIPTPGLGWKTQVEKRNAYLEKVPVGDWVFVIDADEILLNRNWKDTVQELEPLYDQGRALIKITNYSDRFRLFVKKEGMKYEGYHWNILDPKTGKNVNDLVDASMHLYGKPMKSLELIHMKWQRSNRVFADKELFYEARRPIEEPHVLKDMHDKALQMKEDGTLEELLKDE